LAQLGLVRKMVKAGEGSGYDHNLVSLDKILCSSEINNLQNFLKPAFCYEFKACWPFAALGWRPRSTVSVWPEFAD